MMNAAEARDKTTKVLEQSIPDELQDIAEKIDTSINDGKYQLGQYGVLSQRAITILNAKGYKIQSGKYAKPYYIIRW